MMSVIQNTAAGTAAASFVASQIGNSIAGTFGMGYAKVVVGQAAWVAAVGALGEKMANGTATGGDYAAVLQKTGDLLLGFGLTAAQVNPWVRVAFTITSGGLFIYNNWGKISDLYLAARGWIRRDPLAIDLDGDGIETVGVDAGILFDHNADGIKTGTGWLKGDDAFLVLDRNGNGVIDSGRELFGVDTLVPNPSDPLGGMGFAADGFVALSAIDSNGDKVFDAGDAEFANVRLWRDLNQDGISQAEELQSLAAAGITAINLTTHQASKTLPGGNTQTLAADVAGIDGGAVSLNLANNPFYRQFPDHLDTTAVADLPDMSGSGTLRDLREAATQSATLAGDLRTLVTQGYVNRDTYLAQIEQLIEDWADTSPLQTIEQRKGLTELQLQQLGRNVTSPGFHQIVSGEAASNGEWRMAA